MAGARQMFVCVMGKLGLMQQHPFLFAPSHTGFTKVNFQHIPKESVDNCKKKYIYIYIYFFLGGGAFFCLRLKLYRERIGAEKKGGCGAALSLFPSFP